MRVESCPMLRNDKNVIRDNRKQSSQGCQEIFDGGEPAGPSHKVYANDSPEFDYSALVAPAGGPCLQC